MFYPNIVKEFGDNSDNKPTNYPLRRLLKRSLVKPLTTRVYNNRGVMNSFTFEGTTSNVNPYITSHLTNISKTSKEFMINYSYRSQPFSKQSVRKYKNLNAHTSNYNLSLGLNSLDSNLHKIKSNTSFLTPFYNYNLKKAN